MVLRFFRGFAGDRHVQSPANGVGDVFQRHTLFGDCVIPVAGRSLLQREPIKAGGVEAMRRGPAVASVADVRRNALLAGDWIA